MPETLVNLRTRAQARADMEGDANVSSATWNAFINASRKRLWRLLGRSNPELFLTSVDFTLSGTTFTLGLAVAAANFWQVLEVDKLNSTQGDDFVRLARFLFAERNVGAPSYRIFGNTLEIRPASGAAGNYRLWYVTQPPVLVADIDTIGLVEDIWDEFIVLEAAIKARRRQQKDASDLATELGELLAELRAHAGDRDVGEPDRVRDVDRWGSGRPALPRP